MSEIGTRTLVQCGGVYAPALVGQGEWWRLLSAMFLHGGMEHLALNMVSLFIVGRMMELYFSRSVYLLLYLLSGIVGFLVSMAVHPMTVSIGASGAIFGIFGAIGGLVLFHRRRLGERYRLFMREFGAVLGLNLIFGIVVPGIDMSAHIGGLSVGLVGGYLASKTPWAFWLFVGIIALMALWIALRWLPVRLVSVTPFF
ncbi:rhomboid family intramembrane serine protease [Nitratifractor sp.]